MTVDGEEPPKKKRVVKKKVVPFIWGSTSLDPSVLEQYKQQEAEMHAADKLVMDTEERKNALEKYIYDMRGKLDDRYASYIKAEEKTKLLAALSEVENWLYSEEGEDATKSVYVMKLDALKVLGDPATFWYKEAEDRLKVVSQLRETTNNYLTQATSGDEKFAHIEEKDKQSVVEKCATVQKWLDDQIARQSERAKNADPAFTSAEVMKKRDEIIYFVMPILTKPKPRPAKVEGTETPKSGQQTPKLEGQQKADQQQQPPAEAQKDNGPPEMNID